MSIFKTFVISILSGFVLMLAFVASDQLRSASRPSDTSVMGLSLRDGVFVREQITMDDVARIKASGFRTLIDLRPDGEAADQPPSAQIGAAAIASGLSFAYIPTPHGDIPAAIPDTLAKELATAQRPVLLYCRSGKRAARVWALAEASRSNGASVEEISAAVTGVSQPVDDILAHIKERVAARQDADTQTSTAR